MSSRKKDRKPGGIKATLAILALQGVPEVAIGPEKLQGDCLNYHLMIIMLLLQKICSKQMKIFKINK
jgi:hypothetical protein